MRYFSMFSGIGGFELGIQHIHPDWECVGYSEIDKYADEIYKKQFSTHKNYGDATRIDPKDLPGFDLLVGGFPCQAFPDSWTNGASETQRYKCLGNAVTVNVIEAVVSAL